MDIRFNRKDVSRPIGFRATHRDLKQLEHIAKYLDGTWNTQHSISEIIRECIRSTYETLIHD